MLLILQRYNLISSNIVLVWGKIALNILLVLAKIQKLSLMQICKRMRVNYYCNQNPSYFSTKLLLMVQAQTFRHSWLLSIPYTFTLTEIKVKTIGENAKFIMSTINYLRDINSEYDSLNYESRIIRRVTGATNYLLGATSEVLYQLLQFAIDSEHLRYKDLANNISNYTSR